MGLKGMIKIELQQIPNWPQTTGVGPIWVTVLLQAEDNMRLRKDLRTLAEEFGKAVPWS
jgi:4-alpha-glucanotransferase